MKVGKPKISASGVPGPLKDLYRDLRDRRLLPLVALLLGAIVAVPIALGADSGGGGDASAGPSPLAALREASADTSTLSVVEAKPGLRDYRRRLKARHATDPFRQRYTKPVLKGAKLNEQKSTSQSAGAGGEGGSGGSGGGSGGSGGGSGGSSGGSGGGSGGSGGGSGGGSQGGAQSPDQANLKTVAIEVTIVRASGSRADGDRRKSKPEMRRRVLPATSLPSRKAEVVNYIGVNPQTRRPLFLVSTEVTAVFGEARCVSGSDRCQMLEVEQGFPETLVRGQDGDRYKVTVTGMRVVTTAGKAERSP